MLMEDFQIKRNPKNPNMEERIENYSNSKWV